jgi:hypothetical protein
MLIVAIHLFMRISINDDIFRVVNEQKTKGYQNINR